MENQKFQFLQFVILRMFSVFNGIIPVTEIGTYTKPPRQTLSTSTTSIPTTMITNLTLASPAEIATNPRPVAMDGWMLLVGILAGTIIMGKYLPSRSIRGGSRGVKRASSHVSRTTLFVTLRRTSLVAFQIDERYRFSDSYLEHSQALVP